MPLTDLDKDSKKEMWGREALLSALHKYRFVIATRSSEQGLNTETKYRSEM